MRLLGLHQVELAFEKLEKARPGLKEEAEPHPDRTGRQGRARAQSADELTTVQTDQFLAEDAQGKR